MTRYFIVLFLILGFSAAVSFAAQGEGEPVSLDHALSHAYAHNPTLLAARAELESVREQLPQAYAGWKPTISSSAGITATDLDGSNFGGGDGSTAKDIGLSIDQPLFKGGSTFAQVAAAKYTIESQEALLRSREQDILLAATSAYMDVVRDQALLGLSKGNYNVIARELEATNDRFEVGELTRTDVSQAEARLARANSDLINARGSLRGSLAIFEEVIGLRPQALTKPHFNLALPTSMQNAIALAEETSPLVVSASNAHKASEEDINDVFGELLPEIGAFSSWDRSYDPSPGLIDEQTTKTIGLSATISLYQAGSVRSRVRQAKHTANQRYMEILETRRQVRQDVIEAWSNLQTAEAEIRSREAEVSASLIAQEGVRAENEFGSRTVLDVLDADQELLDAQVALVTAQRNELVAKFTLLSTLGQLTPETLGFEGEVSK